MVLIYIYKEVELGYEFLALRGTQCKVLDHESGANLFYQATGPIVFIDLNQVQCVIGSTLHSPT